jgi:autotransporter-associated beta strand protein
VVGGELFSEQGANTINSLNYEATTMSVSGGSSLSVSSFSFTQYGNFALVGGGALNVNTLNTGNVSVAGGSTLNFTGNGTAVSTNGSLFVYDFNLATTSDLVNLGINNVYDNNSIDGLGTLVIGAGSTLTSGEYNGFTFNGSLSGSGSLILGSAGGISGNPNSTSYTEVFLGTSPSFTGSVDVAYLSTLQVGAGANVGSGTITLDSGELQASGNATLANNIVIEDTGGTLGIGPLANNITTIDTQTNTLTLNGHISGTNTLMKIGTGTLVLGASNSYSGGTNVTAGTLLVAAAGALPVNHALSITSGSTVRLADNVTAGTPLGTSNVVLSSLSIDSTSDLDIGNNRVIIDYGNGADPIASIAAWIKNGFYDLAGPQILSSDIAADDAASGLSYGIGYADGADGAVAGLPSGEIEIMFTLLGDANLDGIVNSEDFTPFSANVGKNGVWDKGDFNYDGTVNSEDFTPFSANLGKSASLAAAAGTLESANGLSLANVPEPASMGLVLLAGIGALGRRSRRRIKS